MLGLDWFWGKPSTGRKRARAEDVVSTILQSTPQPLDNQNPLLQTTAFAADTGDTGGLVHIKEEDVDEPYGFYADSMAPPRPKRQKIEASEYVKSSLQQPTTSQILHRSAVDQPGAELLLPTPSRRNSQLTPSERENLLTPQSLNCTADGQPRSSLSPLGTRPHGHSYPPSPGAGIRESIEHDKGQFSLLTPRTSTPGKRGKASGQRPTTYSVASERAKRAESTDSVESVGYAINHPMWRQEQVLLKLVISAKEKFSLMPSVWAMHFLGIPIPSTVYYHRKEARQMSVRPRVYNHSDKYEFRGTSIVRKMTQLPARLRDLLEAQANVENDEHRSDADKSRAKSALDRDMAKKLRAIIEEAVHWSHLDGALAQYSRDLPRNLLVVDRTEYMEDALCKDVERQKDFCLGIREIMYRQGAKWREFLEQRQRQQPNMTLQAPVLYGLAVMSELVYVVSINGADPHAVLHIPIVLNMAAHKQQLWNTLGVMLTVCWARDNLMLLADQLALQPDAPCATDSDSDS